MTMDTTMAWTSAVAGLSVVAVTLVRIAVVLGNVQTLLHAMIPPPAPAVFAPRFPSGEDVPALAATELWSDDVLAEHEKRSRQTIGADPWYVDTFGLEEDERAHQREVISRAMLASRRPPD